MTGARICRFASVTLFGDVDANVCDSVFAQAFFPKARHLPFLFLGAIYQLA